MNDLARDLDLLFFQVGGQQFGAQVEELESIEAASWTPRGKQDSLLDLNRLLDLPPGAASRILVVHTPAGRVGIKVDGISARMIGSHRVQPIPRSLGAWLRIQAITGITSDSEHGIIPVLDLDKLAQADPQSP